MTELLPGHDLEGRVVAAFDDPQVDAQFLGGGYTAVVKVSYVVHAGVLDYVNCRRTFAGGDHTPFQTARVIRPAR
ncbi:MAG TPA: hypothetical protein VHN18_03480 [Micromonosporaceae bacterium]|nr:hypothetical protein [Micromonosporaceae bacterium]